MHNIFATLHIFSKLCLLFALLMWTPTLVSYLYQDDAFYVFERIAFITVLLSSLVWFLTRQHQRELRPRDGFALVTVMWLGFAMIAATPLYFYFDQMPFIDAFFEAISGLTTTGATVITGLDKLPPSINFWRHMLNWLGGMGIIVLAVAILPMLGVGGTQLFKAEIPGIEKDNKMAPRISQTAKRLWLMYLVFTILTCLALRLAGMGWFDAICHAMSAFALGGFSTHDNSIAYFNSTTIELVIMLATLAGGINFANHFVAIRQRSLRHYWQNEEVRAMLALLCFSIIFASLYLFYKGFYPLSDAIRYTAFNFISIGLASGFANADFATWPLIVSLWMFFLSNILAGTGSMGGGIKMARAIALAKFTFRETTVLQHPNAVRSVKVNGRSLNEKLALSIMAFVFAYFMTVVVFTFLMMASGLDLVTALTAIVACITNAGPGLGSVGPAHNYAALSELQKLLCALVMLLGRLEIFTVLILFTPGYWKK
ncbi:MAG: potassium transporter TrkG [Alysiella sp.]|uniref:TrkH family potassium uptake protein n=1 Tax=Alysiella sp. TaxID=1872483 RepID=UPI0026DD4BDF|nr:potassium transporter TrkG [Alysiella sp.]MDO4433229.1 potassium transporter TrkG [Alysiella sp.]